MSLVHAASAARAAADITGDPGDEALAAALETAVAAECLSAVQALEVDRTTAGIPTPEEAGFMSEVRVPPGAARN